MSSPSRQCGKRYVGDLNTGTLGGSYDWKLLSLSIVLVVLSGLFPCGTIVLQSSSGSELINFLKNLRVS